MNGYNTNLASEFHVLSLLYRAGYDASLTLGNKKSVDITVVLAEGSTITIDVKAVAGKDDWLFGNHAPHSAPKHFIILVSYEKKFSNLSEMPKIWVLPSTEINRFVKVAKNDKTHYLPRKAVKERAADFENAWTLLDAVAK